MPLALPGDWAGVPDRVAEFLRQMWDGIVAEIARTGALDGETMLHNNATVAYRDQEEGVLLVWRLPHEVRPQSDTGVKYRITGNHTLELELVDPPHRPEYDLKSFQLLEEDHKLCQACLDCLNYYCRYLELSVEEGTRSSPPEEDGVQLLPSNTVVHHFNLCSLLASSRTQCYICQMIFDALWEEYPSAIEHMPNMERFQTEMSWTQRVKPEDRNRLYFVLVQPSKPRDLANSANIFTMDLWPANKFHHNFRPPNGIEYEDSENAPTAETESTDSPRTKSLARWWLSQCKANETGKHDECKSSRPDYLPTRLLHVGRALELGMLQLVSPEIRPQLFTEDRDYITVSHCWGDSGSMHDPLLLEDNFEERHQSGLHVKTLPKTFQDAIQIADWYKVRWIWIDCLCIKQDSVEDWSREASRMPETYANALLNISADSGADSDAGCFVNRERVDIKTLAFRDKNIHMSWYLTPKPQHVFGWMERAPSFSRAWIYRERQLARRILHFTEKEVVWECCGTEGSGFASETFSGGAPFKQTFNLDNKYQVGRLMQILAPNDEETYAVWNDVCESLSTKNLTKSTDMPVILSSLAKEFAQKLPADEYVAGLWKSSLPQSLVWHTRGGKKAQQHDDYYFAPSWSWLSVSCPVKLLNGAELKRRHPLVQIRETAMTFQQDAPFGPLSNASMALSGVLRRIRLSLDGTSFQESELSVFEDDEKEIDGTDGNSVNEDVEDLSTADDRRFRNIGPCYDAEDGDACEIKFDDSGPLRFSSPQPKFFILFVTINQQFSAGRNFRNIECLILEATGEGSHTFRRVGMLKLNDMFALKMRYKFRPPPPSNPSHGIDLDKVWPRLAFMIRETQELSHRKEEEERREQEEEEEEEEEDDTNSPINQTTESTLKEDIAAMYQFDTALDHVRLPLDFLERLTPQTLTII